MRALLIQIRDADDPMAKHEADCVRRKLVQHPAAASPRYPVDLTVENALIAPVSPRSVERYDCVVIGGSGAYSVHHPKSAFWVDALRPLIQTLLDQQVPTLAICFGHQLLGFHLGSTVQTDRATAELGTVGISVTAAGQSDPLFGHLGEQFSANTGHSDHVTSVPDGVTLLARNAILETQAFKVDGAPFYSTQFHPDLSGQEAQVRSAAYQEHLVASRLAPDSPFDAEADQGCLVLTRFMDAVVIPAAARRRSGQFE